MDESFSDDNSEFIATVDAVEGDVHGIYKKSFPSITVTPIVQNIPLSMELDTGSAVSIIPEEVYRERYYETPLLKTSTRLKTYTGEEITPIGMLNVSVNYHGQVNQADLYVVQKGKHILFGRDWLNTFKLDWKTINKVQLSNDGKDTGVQKKLESLIEEFAEVFSDSLGTLKGSKAKLHLKPDAVPKFCKARQVPYALRQKVDAELQRLEEEGIISKVEWSDWASPVVAVPKPDGSVRICGDFKSTVNPQLNIDQYPLPRTEDIFSGLSGGKKFSKLDLRNAYLQMEVEEDSKTLLTINTHKGLYRYNRLAFGIASAPAIWQRTIDQILREIGGSQGLQDDMLVTGNDDEDHLGNLRKVLTRLADYGLKARREKCEFFKDSLVFCGHKIDKDGLHKTKDKVQAVLDVPRPKTITELRSFLGLINYYAKFIPGLSQMLRPLTQLLEKDRAWIWSAGCESAFRKAKESMASDQVLAHYNPELPIKVACDAGPSGIGCVLSHVEGTCEKPIAFASRSLNVSERNYSQIDKEALALVWGVKKFYPYLYGRHFRLATDHRPLLAIFNPSKEIPVMSASRLQRYALFLSGLDYSIEFIPSKFHGNADALSRLPIQTKEPAGELDATDVFHISQMDVLPITADQVRKETLVDPVLRKVLQLTKAGWGEVCSEDSLRPYFNRQTELSVTQDILMWGVRVVIPERFREPLLNELHVPHLGIVKMKSLARGFIWWPNLDADIELVSKNCNDCLKTRNEPRKSDLHPWEWPSAPWRRVHADFAGPYLGKMFFILMDAHSKWPEVKIMQNTTTTSTINVLREVFSRGGIPEQLVTDNGPQFISEEFALFMRQNGIYHIRTAPYHPATNGLAERFVQTLKSSLESMMSSSHDGNVHHKLANCLFAYRTAPHSTTGQTPAKLFLGRELRSRLSLLKPDLRAFVENKSSRNTLQKSGAPKASFQEGDVVAARDYRVGTPKWKPGVIESKGGPLSYQVDVGGGLWKRHAEQIIPLGRPDSRVSGNGSPNMGTSCNLHEYRPDSPVRPQGLDLAMRSPEVRNPVVLGTTPRYPKRNIKPPVRLDL